MSGKEVLRLSGLLGRLAGEAAGHRRAAAEAPSGAIVAAAGCVAPVAGAIVAAAGGVALAPGASDVAVGCVAPVAGAPDHR